MKHPKQININGTVFKVKSKKEITSPDGTSLLGYIRFFDNTIKFRIDAPVAVQRSTVLHEVIHGILSNAGHSDIDPGLEERVTECVSNGVLQVLRANPKFTKWLLT